MPKLRLKVTHTHGGVAYPPGHVIDVDDHTARWLIDQQIGERDIGTPSSSDPVPVADPVEPQKPSVTRTAKTPKE